MLKNTASQTICFQGISATDGDAVTTGTPTVYVLGDGGTMSTGGGTKTHEGQGVYSYVPTQAETNYDHVSYTMVLSGAINHTINVYPSTFDYTSTTQTTITESVWTADLTQDDWDTAGMAADQLYAALNTVDTNVDAILVDTGTTLPGQINVVDANVDAILVDTGTTIPATLTTIDNEIATIDVNVDAILEDTGTTLPATLTTIDNEIATIDANVDSILEDTGTTLPATLATIDGNVDDILEDTGTTLPASLTTIDNEIEAVDTVVDAIKVVTDQMAFTTSNQLDVQVISMATDSITASAAAADFIGAAEIADSAATEIADKIAADWVAGDASPLAIVAALKADSEWSNLATIDANIDLILEDTGTTLPATLATIDANVDDILEDTGTTLPATLATIDGNVDSILVDTGTTLPASLTTIDNEIATIDANVDLVLADTNELQTDWVNGGRLDLLLDTAAGAGGTVDANITSILGTALTEATGGRIAGNFDTFFENSNSATTKVVDDIGSATVSGSIDANVTQIKGSDVTETTAGRLAANFSTLFDNGDAASTKVQNDIGTATFGSTVDANVVQYLGTAITETTSGRAAQNWSTLYDNNDQASAKLLSDIGTAVVTGQLNANLTEVLGSPLTETTASNLADNISQFYDLDTTTTKTVNDVDQATVTATVDANITQILGTAIAESTSGRIAANWDEFYDNDDAASAVTLQTLQDVDDSITNIAGSGARTITVNVKDTASTPANLENAKVRLTEGINTFTATTDATGNAVFGLDDATYSYAITKNGYVSETGTIVVTADATVNKDIEQSTITGSSGSDTSTGVLTCYDENYAAETGVTFSVQMTVGPGVAGDALDTKVRTADSDGAGLVQFTNLIRGATYQIWRSTFTSSSVFGSVATANAKVTFVVPDSASFDLPEVLGVDDE